MKIVHLFVLRGLSYDGSAHTAIFADASIDLSTIPAPVPVVGSGQRLLVPRLVPGGPSGATWGASVRDPVGRGGSPEVTLRESPAGDLARLLAPDLSSASTASYSALAKTIAPGETEILVRGLPAPAEDQILYLGAEALKVANISTDAADETLHLLTVERAACGSWAQAHAVDPDGYLPGDPETHLVSLILTTRPRWGEVRYDASLYAVSTEPDDPSAYRATLYAAHGCVSERPRYELGEGAGAWRVRLQSQTAALAEHRLGGAEDLPLSHLLAVERTRRRTLVQGQTTTVQVLEPERWATVLTGEEAERLLRVPLRLLGGRLDPVLVAALDTALDADPRVSYDLAVKDGAGQIWIGGVRKAEIFGDSQRVRLSCELRGSSPGASLDAQPFGSRPYVAGWNSTLGIFPVATGLGEPQPTATLRVRIVATFPEALRLLLLSSSGAEAHGEDDTIFGLRGAGVDPDLVNVGDPEPTALDVDPGTTEIAQLGQILTEVYEYHLTPKTTLGEWLANELTLASCLLGPSPSFGRLGARRWYRVRSGPATLTALASPGSLAREVETVAPVRALEVQRGIRIDTLAPTHIAPVRLAGRLTQADLERRVVVRVWQRGGAITAEEIGSGPIGECVRAQLGASLGGPRIWEIPVSLLASVGLADLADWSDGLQVDAAGRGISLPVLVVGIDRDARRGRQVVRVLEDALNRRAEADDLTAGQIAPALRVEWVRAVDSATYEVGVASFPEGAAFSLSSSHGAIWRSIQDAEGWVRVTRDDLHAPDGDEERAGPADLYAQIVGLTASTPSSTSYLTLSVDSGWTRGDLTIQQILAPGAWLTFPDRRTSAQTPPGISVAPIPGIGYAAGAGYDALRWGPDVAPSPDAHLSTVGT